MPVIKRSVADNVELDFIEYTPDKVCAAIKKLKAGGSCGPDGYPPLLLKKIKDCVAGPFSLMFTSLMSVGKTPEEWSHALVTPVNKSGVASSVNNYRPISLTSVTCKIMEHVIVSDILSYLRHHETISKQQHGFLSGRSTTSNLLETFNDWTLALNDKNSIAVANIDFAKACDTVCHNKLQHKLQSYGISGCLLSWICSFLNGRTQQTRVGNLLSTITESEQWCCTGQCYWPTSFCIIH
jgi:Reverse transcriptase (RNA-dependent DNA polymerase)